MPSHFSRFSSPSGNPVVYIAYAGADLKIYQQPNVVLHTHEQLVLTTMYKLKSQRNFNITNSTSQLLAVLKQELIIEMKSLYLKIQRPNKCYRNLSIKFK